MEPANEKRLSPQLLNARRRQAVKLLLSGMELAAVAQTVRLTRGTITSAMTAYKAGGWKAVAADDGRTRSAEEDEPAPVWWMF